MAYWDLGSVYGTPKRAKRKAKKKAGKKASRKKVSRKKVTKKRAAKKKTKKKAAKKKAAKKKTAKKKASRKAAKKKKKKKRGRRASSGWREGEVLVVTYDLGEQPREAVIKGPWAIAKCNVAPHCLVHVPSKHMLWGRPGSLERYKRMVDSLPGFKPGWSSKAFKKKSGELVRHWLGTGSKFDQGFRDRLRRAFTEAWEESA